MIFGWLTLGFGLVLLVEGLIWALAPGLLDDLLAFIRSLPNDQRRLVGFTAMVLGACLVWIASLSGTIH